MTRESGAVAAPSPALEAAASNDRIQLFDFSVDLLRALLWQYNEAANLQGLLEAKSAWYAANQTAFWQNWITDVFDLRTANDFGLAVWSKILDQPVYINNAPSPPDYPAWGFGPFHRNFDRGNFGANNGNTFRIPTQYARILLQLRYFQLTSSGTVPEINRMLRYVFRDFGLVYLEDSLNMTQRYYFTFPIPSTLLLVLETFDVLPRPAGVRSGIYQGARTYFGFGTHHANFTRGNFGA